MKSAPIYVFALLVLAGCSGGKSGGSAVKVDGNKPPIEQGHLDIPDGVNPKGPDVGKGGPDSGTKSTNPGKEIAKVPPPRKVTPPNTGGWQPADINAQVVAANVTKRMREISNTECKAMLSVQTPEGVGKRLMNYRLASQSTYRIEYLEPTETPQCSIIIADGTKVKLFADQKWKDEKDAKQGLAPEFAKVGPNRFLREFSRAIMSNIVDKADGWAPLFDQLTSGSDGFESRLEKRVMPFNGRDYTSYRLYAKRSASEAERLGPATMEIVIDAKHWLPVTIRTEEEPIGGKLWSYDWAGSWNFGQRFTADQLGLTFVPMPAKPSI